VCLRGNLYTWETAWSREVADLNAPSRFISSHKYPPQLMFVGAFRRDAVEDALFAELEPGQQAMVRNNATGRAVLALDNYNQFFNNCQHSAARVRANIMQFQRSPIDQID
jgi:hypothetical protein